MPPSGWRSQERDARIVAGIGSAKPRESQYRSSDRAGSDGQRLVAPEIERLGDALLPIACLGGALALYLRRVRCVCRAVILKQPEPAQLGEHVVI